MIKKILLNLSNDPSILAKQAILNENKDNEILKRVLYMAESKRVKFYVKQIPEYTPFDAWTIESGITLDKALFELSHLSCRNITGNAAYDFLRKLLESLHPDDADVLVKVVLKDTRTGVGTELINKTWPGLVEKTPYMGASAYDPELVVNILSTGIGAKSQIKMDGEYANVILHPGEIEAVSRSGETYYLDGANFLDVMHSRNITCVLNGELIIPGMNRYTSNGIISKLISIGKKKKAGTDVKKELEKFEKEKNQTYEEALSSIVYVIWDMISLDEYFSNKSSTPYRERFANVESFVQSCRSNYVRIVDSRDIMTLDDAKLHFKEAIINGEEGTIVKAMDGAWVSDKPKWQVKMKLEIDVDLKIVGFNMGSGKNSNVVSSFNATTSDDKMATKPQGLTEEMMKYVTQNRDALMGTVITVKCTGISRDKKGNYSLLHPYFKQLRPDKLVADSIEQIEQIEKMAKELGK